MVRVLGHRQTKGAATDHSSLPPPRHISTLQNWIWVRSVSLWPELSHSQTTAFDPEPPDGSPETGHSNGENATFHTTKARPRHCQWLLRAFSRRTARSRGEKSLEDAWRYSPSLRMFVSCIGHITDNPITP